MIAVECCQMDERQMLATLRRDHLNTATLVGVACNAHVADRIRDELVRARRRWNQPVHLIIDPRLRCHEIEVYCSSDAWEERRQEQEQWEAELEHSAARA
jgi:hypothetical protein